MENILAPTQTRTNLNKVQLQERDSKQTCNRKSKGHTEENVRLLKTLVVLTCLEFFILFLPTKCIKETLLPMASYNIDENEIRFAEFLRYLSLWFIMSTQVKTSIVKYFSSLKIKINPCTSGALFKLNEEMTYNRFCEITRALTYTDMGPPSSRDKFYEIRRILTSFSTHMKSFFLNEYHSIYCSIS